MVNDIKKYTVEDGIRVYGSQIDFFADEEGFIGSPNNETAISILGRTEVIYNDSCLCNIDYCKAHDIVYYKGKINRMGVGVMVNGSIILTVKRRLEGGEALCDRFSKALCSYLADRGLECVRHDNNDVMVSGGKVASGGEILLDNGFYYMGYQISINQDVDAIKSICIGKPMLKYPRALSSFGITTEEIFDFCKCYWSNN